MHHAGGFVQYDMFQVVYRSHTIHGTIAYLPTFYHNNQPFKVNIADSSHGSYNKGTAKTTEFRIQRNPESPTFHASKFTWVARIPKGLMLDRDIS